MRVKKAIEKGVQLQTQSKHQRSTQSLLVCQFIVSELLKKVETELPPDINHLMTYSELAMKKTTQKIVHVNLLQSDYINNFINTKNQRDSFYESNNRSQNCDKQKNIFRTTVNSNSKSGSPKMSLFTPESINNSSKLVEDEEIILQKEGVKFVKMQDVKNLIKSRSSDMFSSAHCSYNPAYQKIHIKHSLYQLDYQKPERKSLYSNGRSTHKYNNKTAIISTNVPSREPTKSFRTFTTLQQINSKNDENKTVNEKKQIEINRERISAMLNCGQFVNIEDYYQQKNKQLKKNKNKQFCKQFLERKNKDNGEQNLSGTQITHNSTLANRESQSIDDDDIVINRLRERKERFYRPENNFDEDFLKNKNKQGTILINRQQKNSQKDLFGPVVAFDYNGSIMPTIKYDMLKIPQHYQDMDFSIMEQDESEVKKKKQRKTYVFSKGINHKLVDHKKFLPHSNCNFNPLAEKKETQMKQIAGYMLKKGVQVRPKQDDSFPLNAIKNEQEQNCQKINKGNFEFLHNQEIKSKPVRFQQFLKYKKNSLSQNKNITSKKKDEGESSNCEQSLLSRKSMSIKMLNTKTTLQDKTNEVHKSQNPQNLQMLINNNQDERSSFEVVHFEKNQQTGKINPLTRVLKKSSINRLKKFAFNDSESNFPKKKVRIA